MSKTPNFDAKIKAILDATIPGERTCEMTGETWMMDEEEIGWYKKFNVPPSPFSPRVRKWHLCMLCTTYQWWWNTHPLTGQPVLSYVHPASGVKVLPDREWFEQDFSDRSLPFDATRSFFDQLKSLQLQVPINATRNLIDPENSIATTSMGDQNSYFVAGCTSKNSLYLCDCQEAEASVDCNAGINITDCYRVNHSSRLHRCFFAHESYDCIDSAFLFDCRNCEFCFGASNQRNKKYLWWNEQLTKDEWEKRRGEVDLGLYETVRAMEQQYLHMIGNEAIWPENFNHQTDHSSGEYMIGCTGCVQSSYGIKSKNNYFCYGMYNAEENAYSIAIPGERCYQSGPVGQGSHCLFSSALIRCDDVEYSLNCYDCEHCFGCVGLRRKRFCIFNQQYEEAEYWQKVDEMKCAMLARGEYGRPFPGRFSMAYYPESGPAVYMGTTEKDWDTMEMPRFEIDAEGAFGTMRMEGKEVLPPDHVPSSVDDFDESWAGRAIMDTEIKRPFTYLKPEIAFYKKHHIAPPRQHFTARIRDLMWQMNTGLFEETACAKCSKSMTVATNRTFTDRKIYCMGCYLKYLEQHG